MSLTKLDIDRFISSLRTKSKEYNSINNVQLASMLEETISNIKEVSFFWATICSDNKGTTKTPAEGEEWLGGPFASVLATQYYIKSLTNDDDLAEKKYNSEENSYKVFPNNFTERITFPFIDAKVIFNKSMSFEDINKIDSQTSCVVLETIQGSAGFILPKDGYLGAVKKKCEDVGALLILDEIQTGIGRTGKLFGFENFDCIPDVIVYGKGLGGGIPIGAFTSSKKLMDSLHINPILGHITTFGGNPVITAAALQTLKIVLNTKLSEKSREKETIFRKKLNHKLIKEIRGVGLMLCLIMTNAEIANRLVLEAKDQGLILFWLLIEKRAVRITPPLTISKKEIEDGCNIILNILDSIQ